MDDTSKLLARARGLATDLSALAGELLLSGADVGRVHREYVVAALELLGEAEAQGLLAAAGDRGAHAAIEDIIERLSQLRRSARTERNFYADPD